MANPTNPDIDALVHHTISNLPDGIAQRIHVLKGLVALLPHKYPRLINVNVVLVTLEQHDAAQRELALTFKESHAR